MSKFSKMVQDQNHLFKLDILEQFCATVHETLVVPDEEDGPWREQVQEKRLVFKRVELLKNFGVLHLHYHDDTDPSKTYRLSLELKKS